MITVVTLFVVGIVLVAVEILVPGGLLGALAGLFLLAGVVTAFVEFGPSGGTLATAVALLIAIGLLYFEFVVLPRTKLAKKFSMTETVAGRSQPEIAERGAVIGCDAIAATTLAPSGYVEVDGRRYEAFCQSGHVAAGARLRVVEVDTFRLVVTQIKESS